MRFLIADDSKTMRYLVQQNLKIMGVGLDTIVMCESGEQALDILKRGVIDFAFLDWHMSGMNGFDVLKKARTELGINIPIVMLTTEQKRKNIELAIQTGADDYIIKPLDAVIFRKKILAIARKHGLSIFSIQQSAPSPAAVANHEEVAKDAQVSEAEWKEVESTLDRLHQEGKLPDIDPESAENIEMLSDDDEIS